MRFLKKVIAKDLRHVSNELTKALYAWVKLWKPKQLLDLYREHKSLFKDLPKGPNTDLYRMVSVKTNLLDSLLNGGALNCKRDLESWSTSKRIRSDFAKSDTFHQIVFKKKVPAAQRIAYIPEISLGFNAADFANEGEVITTCQSLSAKDIWRISPATGTVDEGKFFEMRDEKDVLGTLTLENFLKIRQKPLTEKQLKEKAVEIFKSIGKVPKGYDNSSNDNPYSRTVGQGYYMLVHFDPKTRKPLGFVLTKGSMGAKDYRWKDGGGWLSG